MFRIPHNSMPNRALTDVEKHLKLQDAKAALEATYVETCEVHLRSSSTVLAHNLSMMDDAIDELTAAEATGMCEHHPTHILLTKIMTDRLNNWPVASAREAKRAREGCAEAQTTWLREMAVLRRKTSGNGVPCMPEVWFYTH